MLVNILAMVSLNLGGSVRDSSSIDRKISSVAQKLCDPKASPESQALMNYLVSEYGKATLSGQQDDRLSLYIKSKTGHLPAIQCGDLSDYSPSRVVHETKPPLVIEDMLLAARLHQIIGMQCHWNAPDHLIDKIVTLPNGKTEDDSWYRGFYTTATTFDLAKTIDDPNSEDYKLLVRDLDVFAGQLKRLADKHIPVLWRPFHEAEGGWFWWGAKGPEPCIKLYKLMYHQFVDVHHLHNLIWIWNSLNPAWYPGNKYVDIVAADLYPKDMSDNCLQTWQKMESTFGERKLLALTEFGGVPDISGMFKANVKWSFFASWSGKYGPEGISDERLKKIYTSPEVINQDQLPESLFKNEFK